MLLIKKFTPHQRKGLRAKTGMGLLMVFLHHSPMLVIGDDRSPHMGKHSHTQEHCQAEQQAQPRQDQPQPAVFPFAQPHLEGHYQGNRK